MKRGSKDIQPLSDGHHQLFPVEHQLACFHKICMSRDIFQLLHCCNAIEVDQGILNIVFKEKFTHGGLLLALISWL